MRFTGICWKTFLAGNSNHVNNLLDMKFNALRIFFNLADVPQKAGLSENSSSSEWQSYINHVYMFMPDGKREWTWDGKTGIFDVREDFKAAIEFCKKYNWLPIICIGHIEERNSWIGKAPSQDKWLWLRRFAKEFAIYLNKKYGFKECDLEVWNEPNEFMEVNHYCNVAVNMAIGWKSGVSAWKVHVGGVDLSNEAYINGIINNTMLQPKIDYISPHILKASEWDGTLIDKTYTKVTNAGKKLAFLEISPLGKMDRMNKLVGKCDGYCMLLPIRSDKFGTATEFDDILIYEYNNPNKIWVTSQAKKDFITQFNIRNGGGAVMPNYTALTQLTPNFKYGEFFCNGIQPPDKYYANILALATELQKVRDKVKRPIIVNSGWRTPEHNILVKGAAASQHLTGKAADVYCVGLSAIHFVIYLAKYGNFNGFGIINSTSVHVDTRAGDLTIWDY